MNNVARLEHIYIILLYESSKSIEQQISWKRSEFLKQVVKEKDVSVSEAV
jgi:hypothetical protein